MLKLTVRPGDFIMLGEDIKISFCGGERTNIPIGIEAPKSIPIVRNTARDVKDFEHVDMGKKPYVESKISAEAKEQITAIIAKDRWQNKQKKQAERNL